MQEKSFYTVEQYLKKKTWPSEESVNSLPKGSTAFDSGNKQASTPKNCGATLLDGYSIPELEN